MGGRRSVPFERGMEQIDVAVSQFGSDVFAKLRIGDGSPEDHLRAPLERLFRDVGRATALRLTLIGETRLPDLSVRPDFAVDVDGGRVGYIEVKRPGHGVPGTWKHPTAHDRRQWEQLRQLPNVLYTDGEQFACYHFGVLRGRVARLVPGLPEAGNRLRCDDSTFSRVVYDFLHWKPEQPRTPRDLVRMMARLCRVLRDDVLIEMERERAGVAEDRLFTRLATDWRQLLFPNLTDTQFADQYAQTVTFALLLAGEEGIKFGGRSLVDIARQLGRKHSFMGKALAVLTDQPDEQRSIALDTMLRVLAVVNWAKFPHDTYMLLYETFLIAYDPRLRRQSGVYYTPAALVEFTTRFVDDVLRTYLDRRLGFADDSVMVVDPAMGTGSFLAAVINSVATTVEAEDGAGAVAPRLRDLASRLVGFEKQAAPFAVAELRIHGLLRRRHRTTVPGRERRFLADALDDPEQQVLSLGGVYDIIERSRAGAIEVKRKSPVVVVIGNPPYLDKIKGVSAWIERRSASLVASPSLDAFRKPGNGKREYVLSNLSIYFWRWATWKVFDAHPALPNGVVAFVCSAGFTTGEGFAGMREYLRRTADEGWIIDLTPEGHQPPMTTRYFRGNQQPICVAVFLRRGAGDRTVPARIRWRSVTGSVDEKSAQLETVRPDGSGWIECRSGWTDRMRPPDEDRWAALPALGDLLPWSVAGVKSNRAWVFAPEEATLHARWARFVAGDRATRAELLKGSSAALDAMPSPLGDLPAASGPLSSATGPCPPTRQIAFRPFDRMHVLADARLHDRPRPPLWTALSDRQIHLVEQHDQPIDDGPAVMFTALLPDMHAHSGRGGRALPMYQDAHGRPNVAPGLLAHLSHRLGTDVSVEDLVAYIAAVAGHRGYTRRFVSELGTPGVRLPLTLDLDLWSECVRVGRQVQWLHTFGKRGDRPSAAREDGALRRQVGGPLAVVGIPDTESGMPEKIGYDPGTATIEIGRGRVAPVSKDVWTYRVGRMQVVSHWFGYRRRRPKKVHPDALDAIVACHWTPSMTTELIDLLHILDMCVELETAQNTLLDAVCAGQSVTNDNLRTAGVLPVPDSSRGGPPATSSEGLFSM